jgi:NAD-dependent SIR2 family protein deacetylase
MYYDAGQMNMLPYELYGRKQELWESIRGAVPNKGHMFFKRLYDERKLVGLITQNIEELPVQDVKAS